jgi:hypothetical protein
MNVIDRPVLNEIEVTPEMLEAASAFLAEYYLGDGAYDLRDPCLAGMYRVMERVRRCRSLSPDGLGST